MPQFITSSAGLPTALERINLMHRIDAQHGKRVFDEKEALECEQKVLHSLTNLFSAVFGSS